MQRSGGFTLTEMLLSVALIAMLVGLSLPVYTSFLARNDLDIATQSVGEMLRRAQVYARGVKEDSQWGVAISGNSAVLFKGVTFAARDTNFDETVTIPVGTSASGLTEVTFSPLHATPTASGTMTLSTSSETRTITLNAKGMVDY